MNTSEPCTPRTTLQAPCGKIRSTVIRGNLRPRMDFQILTYSCCSAAFGVPGRQQTNKDARLTGYPARLRPRNRFLSPQEDFEPLPYTLEVPIVPLYRMRRAGCFKLCSFHRLTSTGDEMGPPPLWGDLPKVCTTPINTHARKHPRSFCERQHHETSFPLSSTT